MHVKNLTRGALLVAIGVALPQVFHLAGGAGPVFLPMHIPVLLAGLLVCPWAGLYVGFLAPLISHFATGMPPLAPIPMLILMLVELPVMGVTAAWLFRKANLNIAFALPGAMLAGRIALGTAVFVLVRWFGYTMLPANPLFFIQGAVLTGMPGIALQLALIPALVSGVERGNRRWGETSRLLGRH